MKRAAVVLLSALALLPARASMEADGVWKSGVWATTAWADNVWFENGVPVPDVVGQASFAAADAILEGDGLDGTEVVVCSAAVVNEVVSQDPLAGATASLGTVVTVRTSSGVECTWDTTGIPAGWYTIPTVLADNDFRREMRVEADGDGVWAYWLAGAIRGTANLQLNMAVISAEATSGGADWARWAPGTQAGNTGNLQLNMIEAFSADFQ